MSRKSGLAGLLERLAGKKRQVFQAVKAPALPAAKGEPPAGSGKTAPAGEGKTPAGSAGKSPVPSGGTAPRGTSGGKAPSSGAAPRGTAEVSWEFRGNQPQTAQGRGGGETRQAAPFSAPAFSQGEAVTLAGPPADRARELSELLRVQRRLRPSAGEFGEEVV